MKLELKHLSPYLPYNLKGIYHESIITLSLNGFSSPTEIGYDISLFLKCEIKPILRPLSDLNKEITHDGKTFVPMKWMEANINKNISFYQPINTEISLEIEIITEDYSQTINLYDGCICAQKLHEWHFDVFGLIDNGLAININTLKS
jgi:hypothetical protein